MNSVSTVQPHFGSIRLAADGSTEYPGHYAATATAVQDDTPGDVFFNDHRMGHSDEIAQEEQRYWEEYQVEHLPVTDAGTPAVETEKASEERVRLQDFWSSVADHMGSMKVNEPNFLNFLAVGAHRAFRDNLEGIQNFLRNVQVTSSTIYRFAGRVSTWRIIKGHNDWELVDSPE